MSDHVHDCPKCNGYWECEKKDCQPDDLCVDCIVIAKDATIAALKRNGLLALQEFNDEISEKELEIVLLKAEVERQTIIANGCSLRVSHLEAEVERLKEDIDGENTELANRAVAKIKKAMLEEIESIRQPYWLGQSEQEWKELKSHAEALEKVVGEVIAWAVKNSFARVEPMWIELKRILSGAKLDK